MKKGAEKAKQKVISVPRGERITKTHHRTGYHKPIKNPTTNYAPDSRKVFCLRCKAHNGGVCPGNPYTCGC